MKTALIIMRCTIVLCTLVLTFSSCSKDTDLLAEYVVANNSEALIVRNLVINDSYITSNPTSMTLDVLANDSYINPDDVTIIETSDPTNGTVTINEDKTITYTPNTVVETENDSENANSENSEDENETIVETSQETTDQEAIESSDESTAENIPEVQENNEPENTDQEPVTEEKPTSDTFTYTVETTDEEGNETTEEGTVKIAFEYGELRAFPGAEGYGKNTTGGRGGKVIHVTNLNDRGTGSLREAIEEQTGPRTVVFDVSGYIDLKGSLKIRPGHGNITIAGQTAPEGGITLRGASVWIMDSNVIMRYVRIRPGKDWHPNGQDPSDENYEPDDALRIIAFSGTDLRNVIVDHCTVSWGRDGIIDITTVGGNSSVKDVTVQNTILSENVDKGYATLISGNVDNVTYYKNFIAHCSTRNIAMNALNGDVEFINNVIYGLGRGAWVKYSCRANLIGNVYFTNPNNPRSSETIRLEKNDEDPNLTKVYLEDNQDDGMAITYNSRMGNHLYSKPNQQSGINPMNSREVKNSVLSTVGSSIYQDEADARVIDQMRTYSGRFIKHESEVGGYPTLSNNTHTENYDTDRDGMSDKWESSNNFSSPSKADSHRDHNNDGFTDLEDYLHHLTQSVD